VLARPHSKWRVLMICVITSLGAACFAVPSLRTFWGFTFPDLKFMLEAGAIAIAAILVVELGWRFGTIWLADIKVPLIKLRKEITK
jgi:hypothetical protein